MGVATALAAGGSEAIDPRTISRNKTFPYDVEPGTSIRPERIAVLPVEHEPPAVPLADRAEPDVAPADAATRELQPDGDYLSVVVGHRIGQSIDSRIVPGFDDEHPGIRCRPVACTDREVVEMLMVGRADFGLMGGKLSRRERHAGIRQHRVAVELFALSVSPKMDVRSLSRQQIRQIFTGKVTRWEEIGIEGGEIVPIAPSDARLAERAQKALMPGDRFADGCVRVPSERHLVDQLLQHEGAIGVLRITDRPREAGQKLLQIEWTPPTPAAFAFGNYPYGIPLQLVTSGKAKGAALDLVDYLQNGKGRELLAETHSFLP